MGLPETRTSNQLLRFLLVGCTNFGVSFTVFWLLYRVLPLSDTMLWRRYLAEAVGGLSISSLDAGFANVIGYGCGIINSFVLNRTWTFGVRHQTGVRFRKFVVLNLICLLGSSVAISLMTDFLRWPYKPVWFSIMAVVTGINFLGSKHWVFRETP